MLGKSVTAWLYCQLSPRDVWLANGQQPCLSQCWKCRGRWPSVECPSIRCWIALRDVANYRGGHHGVRRWTARLCPLWRHCLKLASFIDNFKHIVWIGWSYAYVFCLKYTVSILSICLHLNPATASVSWWTLIVIGSLICFLTFR